MKKSWILVFLILMTPLFTSVPQSLSSTGYDWAVTVAEPHSEVLVRGEYLHITITHKNNGIRSIIIPDELPPITESVYAIHESQLGSFLGAEGSYRPPYSGKIKMYEYTYMSNWAPGETFTFDFWWDSNWTYSHAFGPYVDPEETIPGRYYIIDYVHFIDDNPHNNVPWASSMWEGLYCVVTLTASDGGIWVPVDKLGLSAPYIGVASTIIVATAATAIYVERVKRRKEKQ